VRKSSTLLIAAVFFPVQVFLQSSPSAHAENSILNPPSEIAIAKTGSSLKSEWSAIRAALSIYELDAVRKLSKDKLIEECVSLLSGSDVRFEVDRIDMMRKGWTRYYPFYIGDRAFIARIFLTKEASFQARVPVITELYIRSPAVTLQILPGASEILNDCKIKPHSIYSSSLADKSA